MEADRVMLRKKMLGCFFGKAVGGTLGMPFEGYAKTVDLSFYDPVPTDMLPNDDLDLQVLWACKLAEMKQPVIDRDVFAAAWVKHVNFPWDEYGVAIRNLRNGIPAPYSGSFDNYFINGLGAAIRSEIWACLAPGNPDLAVRYAYEDACVDHTGDGLYAELFLAALESVAFVESDMNRLIAAGLEAIPEDSALAHSIRDTVEWCARYSDWRDIREMIVRRYANSNFTDVVPNLGFMVMALLLAEGDFSKAICLAVNCGLDTDCTGATVGSIMGIVNPEGIDDRWLAPIGNKLVVSKEIVGINPPDTLEGFVELLLELREQVVLRNAPVADEPDWSRYEIAAVAGKLPKFHRNSRYNLAPAMPADCETVRFPGAMGAIESSRVPANGAYLMKFQFKLKKKQCVRVMFACSSVAQVWIDGEFGFGRFGGVPATPSFHRTALNTWTDLTLARGTHELLVAVAPVGDEPEITWTMGVGDAADCQWVADAFYC